MDPGTSASEPDRDDPNRPRELGRVRREEPGWTAPGDRPPGHQPARPIPAPPGAGRSRRPEHRSRGEEPDPTVVIEIGVDVRPGADGTWSVVLTPALRALGTKHLTGLGSSSASRPRSPGCSKRWSTAGSRWPPPGPWTATRAWLPGPPATGSGPPTPVATPPPWRRPHRAGRRGRGRAVISRLRGRGPRGRARPRGHRGGRGRADRAPTSGVLAELVRGQAADLTTVLLVREDADPLRVRDPAAASCSWRCRPSPGSARGSRWPPWRCSPPPG